MKSVRRSLRGRFWKRVVAYVLVWCLILNTSVPTLLALEAVDLDPLSPATGVISTTWGPHTIIETDHGAIIDWSNFNTATGDIVEFRQYMSGSLNAGSTVLNRITSAIPTQFDGTLNGNGRVFVVNPAGIIFGGGSVVEVAQFVASGLSLMNYGDVLTGADMIFSSVDGAGEVHNRATIDANRIYIIGKKVRNLNGIVSWADNGVIVLAAGETVYVAQDGSNVLVEVSDGFYTDTVADIRNGSRINADGANGTVVLAAGDVFSRAVKSTGYTSAYSGTVTYQAAKIESRDWIDVSAESPGSDAGTINLIGQEEVFVGLLDSDAPGSGWIKADGDVSGNGGTVNMISEGTVTIEAGHSLTARGGSVSGDGGTIKVTGEHFEIAGDIDASPQNPANANGTLEIDPPTVTIADGANPGFSDPVLPDVTPATDTIYEQDIEALSNGGTNLIVRADESITVQDILDDLIGGGRGNIELHAPTITFNDTVDTDTISTTTGDIVMAAGAGGINTGHLETGAAGLVGTPGMINLSTTDGGDISTRNLTIKGGQGHAEINVNASGDLSINGNVAVGAETAIDNVPGGADAEAIVSLSSGDDMLLGGTVTADAHATNPGDSVTQAHIGIFSGTNDSVTGDATINGDLIATAQSNEGTSDALVEVDTWGAIFWGTDAAATADGDSGEVRLEERRESDLDENGDGDRAQIIITEGVIPDLEAVPDTATTHMGDPVSDNVLENDIGDPTAATLVDGPSHAAAFELNEDGSYSYTPVAGYVGDDTFTYTATDGTTTTDPATVTITMTNASPTPQDDAASTTMNQAVSGNVLTNDLPDPDGDPLTVVLDGTAPSHGSVVLNPDGSFTYTPAEGYVGADTFTYDVTDGQLDEYENPVVVSGTVTITVEEGPTPPPPPPTPKLSPVAPGLERRDVEYSGIPALAKWVALELGVDKSNIEIWMTNALASSRDIQPFETYAKLRTAAVILKDVRGTHIAALTQVINEFASSTAPPTEEQMASIADAIASNAGADNQYGVAEEYLNALAQYISILNSELGFSMEEAVEFATANYVRQLADRGNANVAAYVTARLAEL